MGWSNGMSLLAQIWEEVLEPRLKENDIDHGVKVEICENLIDLFEDNDADDWSCLYDYLEMVEAMKILHPGWEWDENDEDIDDEDE